MGWRTIMEGDDERVKKSVAGKGVVDSDMEAVNDCRNGRRREFRLAVGWQMRQQIEPLLRTEPD